MRLAAIRPRTRRLLRRRAFLGLRRLLVGVLLALAAVLTPCRALAQEVRGTAVEAGGGEPLVEAFVSLVGADGGAVASTLTAADGAFLVAAPAPGTYRLRVERIGYETWTSEPFALAAGESLTRRLEVAVEAVDVSELRVAVESRCGPREGAGERLLAAWEEVRKALDVARWTHEPERIRYEVRVWERHLDVTGRRLRRERDETAWKTGAVSFASLPPEDLAEGGYVRREGEGWEFYAPDAATLLSDSFREEHCFRLVPGEGPTAGLVGLAFEPTDFGDPEVEGALWLDPATGELRHLEFEYVGLDLAGYPREQPKATGRVEYRRVPPGIWLVARWRIRMPELGRRDAGMLRPEATIEHGLGLVERGGEITRLELASGETLELTERGTVAGRLGDGVTGGPLAEAAVYLAGTGHVTFSDAAGRFRFDLVPPGTYTLRARHPDPRLDGLEAPPHLVEVEGGETTSVWLDFPASWAAERLCASAPGPREGTAALLGRVVSGDGSGVPGAVVWIVRGEEAATRDEPPVSDTAAEAEVEPRAFQADSTGAFLLCGLAPGRAALQAAAEGLLSDTVRVELSPGRLALQDLALSAPAVATGEATGDGDVTALRGTVRSAESGEPVSGARVALLGTDLERVTGEDGTFFIPDVPRGRHRLVTEHLGMASDTVEVDLTQGTVQVAVLTLDTRPIALPTLDVEIERTFANPRLAGFYERMERGLGDFITKEDLGAADVIANFRRIPSVRIQQCVHNGRRVGGCWDIKIARGAISERSFLDGPTGRCPPLLYIDGQLLPGRDVTFRGRQVYGSNSFTFLQQYPVDRIEGIEVYRNPTSAPAQYRMLGDACGIILVWTRGR